MTPLERAMAAARRGWHVHPVEVTDDGHKKPVLKDWPNVASTDERKLRGWFGSTNYVPGLVTGQRSDLYIVDVDDPEAAEQLQLPLSTGREVQTRRPGGRHFYFSGPLDGQPVRNSAGGGVDFRGDGGFVVLWSDPPSGTLAPLPQEVVAWARAGRSRPPGGGLDGSSVILEGARETTLVSMAGSMRRVGFSEAAILAALQVTNGERVQPPLDNDALERIAHSIGSKPADKGLALRARLLSEVRKCLS